MTEYIPLMISSFTLQEKQQLNKKNLINSEINDCICIDKAKPRNREVMRFMHLFNLEFFSNHLNENARLFYSIPYEQFKILQDLTMQIKGKKPRQIEYRGNYFTSDIYIKSFTFIEIKQITIGINK